jgi:hypothetical protein
LPYQSGTPDVLRGNGLTFTSITVSLITEGKILPHMKSSLSSSPFKN